MDEGEEELDEEYADGSRQRKQSNTKKADKRSRLDEMKQMTKKKKELLQRVYPIPKEANEGTTTDVG